MKTTSLCLFVDREKPTVGRVYDEEEALFKRGRFRKPSTMAAVTVDTYRATDTLTKRYTGT